MNVVPYTLFLSVFLLPHFGNQGGGNPRGSGQLSGTQQGESGQVQNSTKRDTEAQPRGADGVTVRSGNPSPTTGGRSRLAPNGAYKWEGGTSSGRSGNIPDAVGGNGPPPDVTVNSPDPGTQNLPTASSLSDYARLIGSIIIWIVALFFVFESARLLGWIFRDDEKAPKTDSGVVLSVSVSALVIIAWFVLIRIEVGGPPGEPILQALVRVFIWYPRAFTPGFLLASFLPGIISAFKLSTAAVILGGRTSQGHGRSFWLICAYLAYNVLTVVASIVTLLEGWKRLLGS